MADNLRKLDRHFAFGENWKDFAGDLTDEAIAQAVRGLAGMQSVIASMYRGIYKFALRATGRDPTAYIAAYKSARGMSWSHDVHDWLGGYPYESVTPQEITTALDQLGFDTIRSFEKPAALQGVFGSHCDEFVAVRRT